MRLFIEPGDENACPLQCHVEIVDAFHRISAVGLATSRRISISRPTLHLDQGLQPNQLSSTDARSASLLAAVAGAKLRTATVDNVAL